eukprot:12653654-Ditylum_brightwellii.AAC.1
MNSNSYTSLDRTKGIHLHNLYIDSAWLGNSFALTRLGKLCGDSALSKSCTSEVITLVRKMRPISPFDDGIGVNNPKDLHNEMDLKDLLTGVLAADLWFEGAMRGSPLAQ